MASSFELEDFLPYRISCLAEKASLSLAKVYAQRFSITVAQWRILATLQAFPGMQAKAIGERCNLDKVKVSRAVQDLEVRRLLSRRASARDGRASELRLSAQGKRLFAQIAPRALAWESEFLSALSSKEQQELHRLLDKLEPRSAAPRGAAASAHTPGRGRVDNPALA